MSKNHIGQTIYVTASAPETNDAAGFEALSWTKANGILSLPQFGISHNMIDVPDLQTGFTTGLKGAASGNDTTMTFRRIASDSGQGILKTQGEDETGTLSVKVVDGTGDNQAPAEGDRVLYATGLAHSYMENQGTDTSYEGFAVGFKQNAISVEATEPAA